MSLAQVIAAYGTGTYTVHRQQAGGWSNGKFVRLGAESTFTIEASVQPMTGELLKDLPEGMNSDDSRTLWTTTELRTASLQIGASDVTTGGEPDVIEIENDRWRVTKVEHFAILDNFYRCVVTRLGAP